MLGLVMVVSHDCHLDKELHLVARALLRANPDRDENWAYEKAEPDDTLDHVIVSQPDRQPDDVSVGDTNMLLAGRIVGFFPVPASPQHGLTSPAVVDLGHRTTVDRLTLTRRLASITDDARLMLRYALARMDSLRTPDLTAELEAAVGERVTGIERPTGKRVTLVITLEDGNTFEVLPGPGTTPLDGPRRQAFPRGT